MDGRLRVAIGAIVCATAIGRAEVQAAPQARDQAPSAARNYVVIGCVGREGPGTPSAGGAAPARAPFTITDTRGNSPARYRLDGDTDELQRHVGHTLEIAGPIVPGSMASGGGSASAALPTLKVQTLTYISTTCSK